MRRVDVIVLQFLVVSIGSAFLTWRETLIATLFNMAGMLYMWAWIRTTPTTQGGKPEEAK